MRVNHERRLLNKAAEAGDCRISVRQRADASWPGDHSRLTALESTGRLQRIHLHDGPEGSVAVWQITAAGLSQLQALTSGAA
ncbi:hypothetical protein MRF4_08925 [Methylobacterium radiotolerans]|uniref:ArsR family transcriptional regulator n=1 Tax=Methylobacterium oryzae TaxID=334852 RepID=A0ABU7TKD0_9HYPH